MIKRKFGAPVDYRLKNAPDLSNKTSLFDSNPLFSVNETPQKESSTTSNNTDTEKTISASTSSDYDIRPLNQEPSKDH